MLLKSKCYPKIEILPENRNFTGKSKFYLKIEILPENRNFTRKSKFYSKIEILSKDRNFNRKSKFYPKIEILSKDRNFTRKSKFFVQKKKRKFEQKWICANGNIGRHIGLKCLFFRKIKIRSKSCDWNITNEQNKYCV